MSKDTENAGGSGGPGDRPGGKGGAKVVPPPPDKTTQKPKIVESINHAEPLGDRPTTIRQTDKDS